MLNYRIISDKTNTIIEEPFFDKISATVKAMEMKTKLKEEFRVVTLTTVFVTRDKEEKPEIDF